MHEAADHAEIVLSDGRTITFVIKTSAKARSLRLKLSPREGLVVVAPPCLERQRLISLVAGKTEWIGQHISRFDAVRHLTGTEPAARPEAFDLPALAESWRIEYKATRRSTVGARVHQAGRIIVAGAVQEVEGCRGALRRWLARHAAGALSPWLATLGQQFGRRYTDLTIKDQRTRWGSCSSSGRISLNCKLLFLPRDLVRYVMLHELCHLLEPNHSERFWIHLRSFEPAADLLHERMRDAWKLVPRWAQRGPGLLLS
jgi:predicted metal-dependent hydrolase